MTVTSILLNLLELSNIFSVLAVFVGFSIMIIIISRNMVILRMHGDDLVFPANMQHHHMPPRIPQMNMMKVHIPFTFKLLETTNSSYSELKCEVSSQVSYSLYVFWGVSIQELHLCLWKSWTILRECFNGGNFLRDHYKQFGIEIKRTPHADEVFSLSLPNEQPMDLGAPPRLWYPLVVFLVRDDHEGSIHPDETVALINVIHIKDNVCTLPTSILSQYLKQANGQLSLLKQLYLATGNPAPYEEAPVAVAEPVGRSNEQLCVVCQFYPLSRALLPCRHTCICAVCFDKIDRCPMCRGPISSYFCIRGEEYLPIDPAAKTSYGSGASSSWFWRWLDSLNERLIDFLGLYR